MERERSERTWRPGERRVRPRARPPRDAAGDRLPPRSPGPAPAGAEDGDRRRRHAGGGTSQKGRVRPRTEREPVVDSTAGSRGPGGECSAAERTWRPVSRRATAGGRPGAGLPHPGPARRGREIGSPQAMRYRGESRGPEPDASRPWKARRGAGGQVERERSKRTWRPGSRRATADAPPGSRRPRGEAPRRRGRGTGSPAAMRSLENIPRGQVSARARPSAACRPVRASSSDENRCRATGRGGVRVGVHFLAWRLSRPCIGVSRGDSRRLPHTRRPP